MVRERPRLALNAFADLIEAWFAMHNLQSDDFLSDDEFSRLEQMVGEEVFDLIQNEVGDRINATSPSFRATNEGEDR